MILDDSTEMGLRNDFAHPADVGMDRLANSVAASHLIGAPALILDFGTAITLDYVAAGEPPVYRGGAIMPGIEIAIDALAHGTAKLPSIDLSDAGDVIARITAESIRSGIIHGCLGAVESLVDLALEEIGHPCRVIATGEGADRFAESMPFVPAFEPDLNLYGLRRFYAINHNYPLGER